MSNKTLLGGAVCAALLLAFGAYHLGARNARPAGSNNADLIDPATGKRVLYWHDPMVPDRRFDKPGKSPFMDMQLVPVFADADKDGGVGIDPRVQQRLGVRTAVVERKSLAPEITAVGGVEYNQREVAVVQARANGFIERVHVRAPLQFVNAGQVLADIYVPDWVAAQEEFLAVQRMQSGARVALQAAVTQRMRLAGMSDQHIAELERSKTVQARLSLRAPIAGTVTELVAREGMSVMNGAPLFRINGLSTVWLYVEVPETQLARIQAGTQVTGVATALPGVELQGLVLAVLPEVSADTRTAKARVELRNDKRLLTPGMFVTIRLATSRREPVLVVPSEAVIVTGERSIVIVAADAGRFRPVTVTTGVESQGFVEVTSGVEEGQVVVASAQFLIDSEASLKGSVQRMEERPSPPPSPGTGRGSRESDSPGTGRGASTPLPVPGEVGRSSGEGRDPGAHK